MLPTQQVWGTQFWEGTHFFFGGGGRGCILTANGTVVSFPGNTLVSLATRSPASKVLPRDQGLAWDAPDYYPRPRSHHPTLPGRALGGRGAKMSALQKCGHQSPPLPTALMQAATHPWITAFQGFMAEQVKKKNASNSLETSLRLTAPGDLAGTVKSLGRAANGPARLGLMSGLL